MVSYKESLSRKIFVAVNYIFLSVIAIVCIFPMLHILAISFSSKIAVDSGSVVIWPVGFQLDTYNFVMSEPRFYTAFGVSVERTILGIVVGMVLTILASYPISLSKQRFKARGFYAWYIIITMLFSGGLIPCYLIVKQTGLMDSIWALILPGAVSAFNVILLQNFFKEIPFEISESAFIDGAGYWTVLLKILVPLSKPVMATLVLFIAVGQWNSWFDGMIYMNSSSHYPLQTYLQTIVVDVNLTTQTSINLVANITQKNSKSAQIIIAMLPILVVYPFLQKYFTKGIILGSVKG